MDELEYRGFGIIITARQTAEGPWTVDYTLHEDRPAGNIVTPLELNGRYFPTREVAEKAALEDAYKEIDKSIVLRQIIQAEEERQTTFKRDQRKI
jgi:hypothetical protein